MKQLNEIVSDYLEANDSGDRAAFDAAMEDKIIKDGYSLSDLMYEVYRLQKDVAKLQSNLKEAAGITGGLMELYDNLNERLEELE